jgi:hypothetical protein
MRFIIFADYVQVNVSGVVSAFYWMRFLPPRTDSNSMMQPFGKDGGEGTRR